MSPAAEPLIVADLPPALTVKQTARLWSCSPDVIYEAIADGRCPVPVLRIGRVIRLPRSAVLEAIGYSVDHDVGHDDEA